MDDIDIVRLSVPGTLLYRDVVLRVVASFCRLARVDAALSNQKQEASRTATDEFDDKVVSAVGEAFNNVAIHGYRGRRPGTVSLELELIRDGIRIRLTDTGAVFDPSWASEPHLASLPESHMGLFIIRACMDTVTYEQGTPPSRPNVLTLTKHYQRAGLEVAER
jgi:serine/threonine-protein kinase RsbW